MNLVLPGHSIRQCKPLFHSDRSLAGGRGEILRQPSLEQVCQTPGAGTVDQLIQLPPHGIGDAALDFFTGAASSEQYTGTMPTLTLSCRISPQARLRRTD